MGNIEPVSLKLSSQVSRGKKMTFKAYPNFDKFPIMEEKAMKTAVTFLVSMVLLVMPCGLFAQQGKPMAPAGSEQAMEQPANIARR